MLTVAEASGAIAAAMPMFEPEAVALDQAAGRVLRQDVSAERDQPPFDRVTMDGVAIRFDSCAAGTRGFAIQGTQHAGDAVQTLADANNCIEVMTGSVLPVGTDCVIPVERITIANGTATIEDNYAPAQRQFIHAQGTDYRCGHRVLRAGLLVTPVDIAIIASCGLTDVQVARQPVVTVVSTGNELVPPGTPVGPHQVRLSNGPAIVAMLGEHGMPDAVHEHLVDDPKVLERRLAALLDQSDLMILSGGVSMGKADFVPQVLADLGVEVVFHKISQRPGKPMWFGIGAGGQAVFALPGNPVSTLVCCRHYVLPAIMQASGRMPPAAETAALSDDVEFRPDLTCFLPVRLTSEEDGRCVATPVPTNTSGDFASLTGTDGYVELAKEETRFPAGRAVPLHRWRMR